MKRILVVSSANMDMVIKDNFIKAKREECRAMAAIPHPAEFEKYYNL